MKKRFKTKKQEKRVKFQLSGILESDLLRAQHQALNLRISLSAALRDIIVLFGVTGDATGAVAANEEDSRFVDYRINANKSTVTPAHHRKRISANIAQFEEAENSAIDTDKILFEAETEMLLDKLDATRAKIIENAKPIISKNEKAPEKKSYFKPRPLSDYRDD